MVSIATDRIVERGEMQAFVRKRNHGVLLTLRCDGRPQASLVTMGLDEQGDAVLVSSYPERAKSLNLRRNEQAWVVVMSDAWAGEWVQLECRGEVVDMPDAMEGLVEYFRVISGEHSDWDDYRAAMTRQDKVLLRLNIESWGPISKGGFPARLVEE
ncbi:PPOX class F420-dependent oxidoreductase [Candidatus Poriferisodalis sp.]|uniref:PPOX class F420-dependent oxidoreductase n=1 Tax=Candidatus Poriferisodalis sp. TaxID=3101277 RepID=UPI003B527A67